MLDYNDTHTVCQNPDPYVTLSICTHNENIEKRKLAVLSLAHVKGEVVNTLKVDLALLVKRMTVLEASLHK